jgi:hypothetical protein
MHDLYQLSEEQLAHAQAVLIDKMLHGTASADDRMAYQQIAARRSALLHPAPMAPRPAPGATRSDCDIALEARLAQTQQQLVGKLVQGTASVDDRAALAATTAQRAALLFPAHLFLRARPQLS